MIKIVRLPLFAALGAMASAAGGARAQAGREPIDWSTVSLDSIGGGAMPTADYTGRVVLLVNTASRCGFTNQYRGLEALWRRYKDKGLVVLGVPSNDFGGQEPGSNDEIGRFCQATFDVTFPLADKHRLRLRRASALPLGRGPDRDARNPELEFSQDPDRAAMVASSTGSPRSVAPAGSSTAPSRRRSPRR